MSGSNDSWYRVILGPVSAIIIFVLSTLANKWYGETLGTFGWQAAVTSLLTFCLLEIIIVVMTYHIFRHVTKDFVARLRIETDRLNTEVGSASTDSVKHICDAVIKGVQRYVDVCDDLRGAEWLMSSSSLSEYERLAHSRGCEEIWVVTSDLSEGIPGSVYSAVVTQNLKLGMTYRYFIPFGAPLIEGRIGLIRSGNQDHMDRLHFHRMKREQLPDLFPLIEDMDFILYNPHGNSKVGYMGFSPDGVPDDRGRYKIRMNERLVSRIVGLIDLKVLDVAQ
jgi:hypothetical protein